MSGRTFLPGEDKPGHETVAVISHALWQRRFGGDPAFSGRSVNIDGRAYKIVGVMPPSFRFPNSIPGETAVVPIDIWVPMRAVPDLEQRDSRNYWAIGRLKSDVTLEHARGNMELLAASLASQFPGSNKDVGAGVGFMQDHLTRGVRPALLMLLGSVGLPLLLACANIAILLLSRAESRRREMAIREAIGAGRSRLLRQAITESILVAFLGAAAGLAISFFGTSLILKFAPTNVPRIEQTSIDAQVVLFTCIVTVGVGILFGIAPALLGVHGNLHHSLKEVGIRSTPGQANLLVRHVLIAGQMVVGQFESDPAARL